MIAIEESGVNNLIRIELRNDFTNLIEQSPVLFLRTLEEITQALHLPSVEEKEEVEQSSQELDLFSFMEDDENQEDVFQEPVIEREVEKSETLEEEIDSELSEVIEMTPTTDFHFPEDLTNFYPIRLKRTWLPFVW